MQRVVIAILTAAVAYWLGQTINRQFLALAERLQTSVGCQINTDC